MTNEDQRITWVDSLKGFAIICVVIGHVIKGSMDAGMYTNCSSWMHDIYNGIYTFHMPLFIVISGFLFNLAYVKGTQFNTKLNESSYKKQILNLAILYVAYSVLMGLSKMVLSGAVNEKITIKDILMIWAKPIQLYWYLYILLIFYVIFSNSFFRNSRHYVLILLTLFAISVISSFIHFSSWFQLYRISYYSFYFYLGNKLSEIIKIPTVRTIGAVTSTISLVLVYIYWDRNYYIVDTPGINSVIALGLVCILIFIFSKNVILQRSKFLSMCGRYNLEIYLLHSYFATINRVLLRKINMNNGILAIILSSILSLFMPILLSYIAKRINLFQIMFKPYYFIHNRLTKTKQI